MICMKSELDIFAKKPVQTNVLKTEEVAYKPLSSLDKASTIEFVSLGHGDTYRDLSSIYIRLKVRLVADHNNTKLTDGKVGVVNNVLHSLFRQCAIYLNGKPIAQTDNNYNYRSYFENLFSYGTESADLHLEGSGWMIDTGDQMDVHEEKKNVGLDKRKAIFAKSNTVELMGRIHGDLLNQPKFLINGVDLRIIFTLEKPEFYVMSAEEANTACMEIQEATLYMNHVTINPNILVAHQAVLSRQNAVYPYKRVEVKSYTVSPGSLTMSIDNAVVGQLPNLMIIGIVENTAYSGSRKLNPFHFQHFNMNQFHLVVNGVQVPSQAIDFDFSNKDAPISMRGYETLFRGTNLHHHVDMSHQVKKSLFDKGFFLLAFDLTPDASYSRQDCLHLLNQGIVRIEARFSEAISKTLSVIVYTEYDATVEIDRDRNVYTSF